MQTMLLAVSGMSPAIITETLYGISQRGDAWPRAIKVITTSVGAEKIWQGLVEQEQLSKLCQELGKPQIPFSRDNILVVPNAQGEPVSDARSREDHEALADFITTTVRNETSDDTVSIHASLAGGRKTMTFYLGYAMSLFGRPCDCLSHVLVSEGFENHPDFFFPTRTSRLIKTATAELDTADAEVTLADIPFIRQRQLLPGLVKELDGTLSFRRLVSLINLGDQRDDIRLQINPAGQQLSISSAQDETLQVVIHVENLWYWCFFLLMVDESLQQEADARGNYQRPASNQPDATLALELAMKLKTIKQLPVDLGGDLYSALQALEDSPPLFRDHGGLDKTLDAVRRNGGITNGSFSTYLNGLQQVFNKELPINLVNCVLPTQMFDEDGNRVVVEQFGKAKGKGYGIPLLNPRRQISVC